MDGFVDFWVVVLVEVLVIGGDFFVDGVGGFYCGVVELVVVDLEWVGD